MEDQEIIDLYIAVYASKGVEVDPPDEDEIEVIRSICMAYLDKIM